MIMVNDPFNNRSKVFSVGTECGGCLDMSKQYQNTVMTQLPETSIPPTLNPNTCTTKNNKKSWFICFTPTNHWRSFWLTLWNGLLWGHFRHKKNYPNVIPRTDVHTRDAVQLKFFFLFPQSRVWFLMLMRRKMCAKQAVAPLDVHKWTVAKMPANASIYWVQIAHESLI